MVALSSPHASPSLVTLTNKTTSLSTLLQEGNQIQQFLNEQIQTFLQHQEKRSTRDRDDSNMTEPRPELTETFGGNFASTVELKKDICARENTLKICTHNIRGINKETDQDILIQYITEKNVDIMGLSETKLTVANDIWAFRNYRNKYKCFSSSNPTHPQGSGVCLLVEKEMAKHIYCIKRIEGHIIAAVFLFKQSRITVIQVYLPSDKKESNRYQRLIRSMINEESKHKNNKIIVMGDFNAVANPVTDRPDASVRAHKWKPEAEIFYFLEDWGFTDIHYLWEMEYPHQLGTAPDHIVG